MEVSSEASFVDVRVVETFAELLFAVHTDGDSTVFFDRLCDATCRLGAMDRAVVFVYDAAERRVRVTGSHGIEIDSFRDIHIDLDLAPLALRALQEDRVIEATDDFAALLPPEYERFLLGPRLVCVPISAGARWPGVIIADRALDRPLTDSERHLLWTFGKLAALADGARAATREHEHAKQLQERIDLAREVHDGVVQRLFGVSLALSGERFDDKARRRCADELQEALAELREALQRPLGRTPRATSSTLAHEVGRMAARTPATRIELAPGADVPAHLEPLAQSVAAEAVRNALKHAAPTAVHVSARREDGTFVLDIVNDGVHAAGGARRSPPGMGLRLASIEALQQGGVVEFGAVGDDAWRVRLLAPDEVPV